MHWSVDALAAEIARHVRHFNEGAITKQQAASAILEVCAFTLLKHPEGWAAVPDALASGTVPLLSEVLSQLPAKRSGDGWLWPPTGAIGNPCGATVYTPAETAEAAVLESLFGWLTERVGCAERIDAARTDEIRSRIEDVLSGRVTAVPWAEARRQILADEAPG